MKQKIMDLLPGLTEKNNKISGGFLSLSSAQLHSTIGGGAGDSHTNESKCGSTSNPVCHNLTECVGSSNGSCHNQACYISEFESVPV